MKKNCTLNDSGLWCCPLCGGTDNTLYHQDAVRPYYRCAACHLVTVPVQFHVDVTREKEEYDLHENCCHDEGYLRFLSRFCDPFVEHLGAPRRGLDFGCGPAPALAECIKRYGHSVALYDPLYNNDRSVLDTKYDFISATEVVEHFRSPGKEFTQLFQMLLPGGCLGLMTKMVTEQAAFRTWHYIRDITHVAFYSKETFAYIGRQFGATVQFVADDVVFLQKRS